MLKFSLTLITGTLLALTIYAIIKDNLDVLNIQHREFFALKILDTSTAATLLVTVIGALVVRHQFVISLRPRMSYTSKMTLGEHAAHNGQTCNVWQIRIMNSGLGAAIINSMRFRFIMSDNADDPSYLSKNEFIETLAKLGLVLDQDYWLEFISNGFTLAPEKDRCLFEIKSELLAQMGRVEAVISFQGLLGDSYERKIFLNKYR